MLYKTIRKYFGDVWAISQDLSNWKEHNAKEIINQSIFKFIFKLDQNAIDDINQLISASGGLNKAEELQIINAQQIEALVIYEERRIILSVITSEFESILLKKEGNILNPKRFWN